MAASKAKFGNLSENEVVNKQKLLQNKSTKSKETTAYYQFKAYLEHLGETDTEFMQFEASKLNKFLTTYWFNVRTESGEMYQMKTLEGIRYSLSRVLKKRGSDFDITNRSNEAFITSTLAFEDAKKELKREGKGNVKHIPDVSPEREYQM